MAAQNSVSRLRRSSGFRVLDDAEVLYRLVKPLVARIRATDAQLADQLRRAARSVVSNIAEGRNRRGGNRAKFFDEAYGSSAEVRTWLRMAVIDELLSEDSVDAAWDRADKVCASLYRAMRA